jgi:hypothetical protein
VLAESIKSMLQYAKSLHFDETPQYDSIIEKIKLDLIKLSTMPVALDWAKVGI